VSALARAGVSFGGAKERENARVARLEARPALARELGVAGRQLLDALGINWDSVFARLMA
jgi:hypothetical protein